MKKILMFLIFTSLLATQLFSFSDESKADLRRAADWWEKRADDLNVKLGELERENPDPSNPKDKTWQEYLKVMDEIKTAEEKQKIYRETARFDYTRSILKDTVQVYKPAADFMEFTFSRGVELVNALIAQSWQDLVKISVDSVLRTRIRAKIRSALQCSEPVKGLEDWLVVMSFGDDPWSTTVDQALLNWAKGEAQGKAMLLSLQAEKGRQIYKEYLEKPQSVAAAAKEGGNPLKWLENETKVTGEKVMDALGLATFVSDIGSRLWLSFEMNDTIDDTLSNLAALRAKYKEKKIDLSCEDLFLVWSKQKTIAMEDPEEQKRLEELKTGLDFFLKKIPGWYQNKTVPKHFDEIKRMIPVAVELGEYSIAQNLKSILDEFNYKEVTPEEKQIEETREYLISNLKTLRNFLQKKYYADADSMWDTVNERRNKLTELGYKVDTDTEIQKLWTEVQSLKEDTHDRSVSEDTSEEPQSNSLSKLAAEEKIFESYVNAGDFDRAKSSFTKMEYMIDTNISEEEYPQYLAINDAIKDALGKKDMDATDLMYKYNSTKGNPYYETCKKTILKYLNDMLTARKEDDMNKYYEISEKYDNYLSELEKYGIDQDDIYKDASFSEQIDAIEGQILEYDDEDDKNSTDTSNGGGGWEKNSDGSTSNSFF